SAVAMVSPPFGPATGELRAIRDPSYIGRDRQPLSEISRALRFGPDEPTRSTPPNDATTALRAVDRPRPGRIHVFRRGRHRAVDDGTDRDDRAALQGPRRSPGFAQPGRCPGGRRPPARRGTRAH